MAGEQAQLGIFANPFFTQVILPFLLIFVVVYAILEKTDILGKGKRQINAIVSLVIALIVVGVPVAVGVITRMIPVITIVIVILLLFMLMFGFIGGGEKGGLGPGLRIAFGILLGITLLVVIIWAVGGFEWFASNLATPSSGEFWQSVVFFGIIATAIAVAVTSGGKPKESSA
jgi:hypothetical protein